MTDPGPRRFRPVSTEDAGCRASHGCSSPPGPDAMARTAADIIVAAIAAAIGARGVAHVSLTGGSSAAGLYRELRTAERLAAARLVPGAALVRR